jgi:type I restriction enzyme S subunit
MKSKSSKPTLRFPEFLDSWKDSLLGEFLDFKNGFNTEKSQYGNGVKFINVLDIINTSPIVYDSIIGNVTMSESEFKNYEVKYGDILFQRSSETREEVGQSNVYLDASATATFGGFVIRGSGKQKYDPLFLHYLLKSASVRKDITSRSGGSTRYNIGQESLKAVRIILPTLPEQQKIAAFLSAMDEKINQLAKKKELLVNYKKGVMQMIFSQKVRFRDGNGNDYPDWREKQLGDMCHVKTGKKDVVDKVENGKYPFFVRSSVVERINSYSYDGEAILIPGDGKIGEVFHYYDGKFDYHQRVYKISDAREAHLKYLYFYLTAFFLRHARSFSVKATVDSLRLPIIKSFIVRLPSLAEQKQIVALLSSLDRRIDLVAQQLENAKTFKNGLLQQMFA